MKKLALPLGLELLLQLVMGSVDTFMVSRLGDVAVSAVGLSNQILTAATTLLVLVNAGAGIVTARFWGGGRRAEVGRLVVLLVRFNLGAGVLLGLGFVLGSPGVLGLAGAPAEVAEQALAYLPIVGGGLALTALQMVMGSVLRSTGDTRSPLAASLAMNGLHLVLNGGFLFGWFGLPVLGIGGTAVSTLVSRTLALGVLAVLVGRKVGNPPEARHRENDRALWGEIVFLGIPLAVTAVSWGFSQVVLTSVVARLGTESLAAWTYVQNLQQYPWVATSAIGGALQILIAHDLGAGRPADARARMDRTVPRAVGLALVLAGAEAALAVPLLGLFTRSAAIVALALPAMVLAVVWHPLRAVAFCVSGGLNTAGGATTVAVATVVGMWLVSTGGAWVLTAVVPGGLAGVFAALITDEALRGAWFSVRWGSGLSGIQRTAGGYRTGKRGDR